MATADDILEAIQNVHDQESFIQRLLVDTLDWELDPDVLDIEDTAYEYTSDELNSPLLDEKCNGRALQLTFQSEIPWGVFLIEFAHEDSFVRTRGLTMPLRQLLNALVPKQRQDSSLPAWKQGNLLFICTHDYRHFRFAYFQAASGKERTAPLRLFGWNEGDTAVRTLCEHNLPHLCWNDQWQDAFDVDRVTRRFYEDYEQVFSRLQERLDVKGADARKMCAQTLMNRLLFLRFVEQKGWLRFHGANPKEYLKHLYAAGPTDGRSWYRSRLQTLFFHGLASTVDGQEDTIGQVPYLNGGLFTITEWDELIEDIEDSIFEPLLGEHGLLYRYNFVVEESTPLNIEVAVDPEMLGKVFEKLVIQRHETGSYYTPRTVVQFMCRESLKGYLGDEWALLVDESDSSNISVRDARLLLAKLADVKIIDPACGSGAYLLGMLQELHAITELLDSRAHESSPTEHYLHKLRIIQNNLYGVDLDEFAVNIARLRLWLSLVVEFDGDTPPPLPNLDYKIEVGDSLTAPDPSSGATRTLFQEEQIRRFDELKAVHMDPTHRTGQIDIQDQIDELKREIMGFEYTGQSVQGFIWRVEFAEVWKGRDGFDIVIANPPYGIKVPVAVRNRYFNPRVDRQRGQSRDSYGIFMARGLQLLRPGGVLSYIVSDTWRTIKSHRPLRKRLLDQTTISHVLDLPAWIFDATVNTGVVTVRKAQATDEHTLVAGDLRGIPAGDWECLSQNIQAIAGQGPDVQTLTCARHTYPQATIGTYNNLSMFIASPQLYLLMSDDRFLPLGDIADVKVGLQTGNNAYYLRKRENARGNYVILDEALLLTEAEICDLSDEEKLNGVNPDDHEGRHFVPYDKGGQSDAVGGWLPNYYVPTEYFIDWSAESVSRLQADSRARFQNSSFYFQQGLSWSDVGVYSPTIRFSGMGVFDVKGSRIIIHVAQHFNNHSLLGILCSRFGKFLIKVMLNHTVSTQSEDFRVLPIPNENPLLSTAIEELVGSIVEHQARTPLYPYHLNEQRCVDCMVNRFYELHEESIREVDLWYCRRYPQLSNAQGLTEHVREQYADHLTRCQRVLERPPSYWRSNPILQLIAQGESQILEFKETLEINSWTGEKNTDVRQAVLKTIAAFLNTEGGTLLIGVADDGEIKGLAGDYKFCKSKNADGLELKIRDLLKDKFEPLPLDHVDIAIERLPEGDVCRVDVRPQESGKVTHLDGAKVYVRDGNRTLELEGPKLTDWITRRVQQSTRTTDS